ncbi:MAG: DUF5105 domain-containing protein [Bacillota bacterium]|nr:DUF5105 domain-containing protein [Bacillota bacterium]
MNGIINTVIALILSTFMSMGMATVIEDEPEEAVEDFFAGLSSGQQQIIEEYKDCDELEKIQEDIFRNVEFKVEDARTKGDVAVAKVKVTNSDFSGVKDAYEEESYNYVMENLYSDDIADKKKLSGECLDIYEKEIAEAADKGDKTTTEIYLAMEDDGNNGWRIILDDETKSALMGGLSLPASEEKDGDSEKKKKEDLANTLREETVSYVLEQEEIPAYSYEEVQAMDMSKPSGVTVEDLKLVTRYKLVGTEETLYQLEQDYNLNCLLLLSIASHESAYGTMQFHPNNVCGYGYSGFSSVDECLNTVGRVLAKNYLDPSGPYYKGKTIDDVNKTYAADPAWDSKVANKMVYFYKVISENHNKQLEKLK